MNYHLTLFYLTYSHMLVSIFFVLITFLTLNSFWFVCLHFLFVKFSNNFFTVEITDNICPKYSIFWSQRLPRANGVQPFEKIFLFFGILTWSQTLNLESFLLCSTSYSVYVSSWTSKGFSFIVLPYALLYLSTVSASLSRYSFFDKTIIGL